MSMRVGQCQHPPDTQPVASQASTDDGQRVDFIRRQEWRTKWSVIRAMNYIARAKQ